MSTARDSLPELQRMYAAVQAAGIGVWLNPLPLGELLWDENTKAHFHLPPDAPATTELFCSRVYVDDRERLRLAIERTVTHGDAFDQVFRTVGPQGQLKWIRAVGRVALGPDGQPRQFDGVTLDITPQILTQQRLRKFADAAPAMLWVTEPGGACTFLSRAWTVFTGQSEAAGLGFGWLDMVHPEDRPRAEAAFREANQRRDSFAMEHRLRAADGSWRWVIDAGQPRISAEGEFLGFVGAVTDINDRRMVEDALRRSRDRYARLLNSIDQGFCVIQIQLDERGRPCDYRFIETNGVFERQTGMMQARGKTARQLVPTLEDFWVQAYGQVALSGQPRRFMHGSAAMGRWFDVFASPIGEPGELQVAILFQDVTQQRQIEERLRESEERYRAYLANSSEGIWRMEFQPPVDTRLPPEEQLDAALASGRFAECNDAYARMHGLRSAADLIGQPLSAAVDTTDPQVRAYLLTLVEAGYRGFEAESHEVDIQGRTHWFANNIAGVLENGWLVRVWGNQRNITARKRAEAALVEADRRKDEFLATLAHELRNPLAPIRSAAELLRVRGREDTQLVRPAEIIARQVGHLARMIDDLMDVSRITRGKLELRMAPLTLQDAVRAAAESARELLRAGRHALELNLPDQPIELVGDEVRLVQIVLNLLANAARYSADGRPVQVEVAREDAHAVIRVRDQGIGIAADQLQRVFDLFYQGTTESERAAGGLGIGLSLVQRLAELHGGSAEALSAGPGQGSEFVVRLPLPVQPLAPADPAPHAAHADASARRVLIVDDNHDAADTLAEMMQMMGFEASTAYDGVEGLAQAEALRPDVLVLDLGMPRLDGYGTCRAVRASEWGRHMAVIALSGWGQAADQERTAQAGFDDHLVKPVSPEALLRSIDEVLARTHSPEDAH